MLSRLRRFLDVRPGEGLPVLLTFLYIAVVVASYLLAKPIRNGLFLKEYGAYSLVYVYAAVPIVLSLFVPLYGRATAKVGARGVTLVTLLFFAVNVLLFWYAFRYRPFELLPAVFYVWVNCFGIIAPVQAWSFANSLFDTRQAKRLFGLVGAGASFGAIAGGLLARFLVDPVGGAINMLLVLAALILAAAVIVSFANRHVRHKVVARTGRVSDHPFRGHDAADCRQPVPAADGSPGLPHRHRDAVDGVPAQSGGRRRGSAATPTRSPSSSAPSTYVLGTISFILQLLVTGPALRRFGIAVTVLVLPLSLGLGSTLVLLAPALWSVLLTNAFDQGFRFSRRQGELRAALPADPAGAAHPAQERDRHRRQPRRRRMRRAAARPGDAGLCDDSRPRPRPARHGGGEPRPHRHLGRRRLARPRPSTCGRFTTASIVTGSIPSARCRRRSNGRRPRRCGPSSRAGSRRKSDTRSACSRCRRRGAGCRRCGCSCRTLRRTSAVARCRCCARPAIARSASRRSNLLQDPDLAVRTEALLYLAREMHVDPLAQIQKLGDFEDYSIRAGMAAFLASPGPSQNLDAARAILAGDDTGSGPCRRARTRRGRPGHGHRARRLPRTPGDVDPRRRRGRRARGDSFGQGGRARGPPAGAHSTCSDAMS